MHRVFTFLLLVSPLASGCDAKRVVKVEGDGSSTPPSAVRKDEPAEVAVVAPPKASPRWPTFRGADRSGVSRETGLMKSWPSAGPKLLWKAENLGESYGTVAIANGRGHVIGFQGNEEVVFAINLSDGKQAWKAAVGPAQRTDRAGARCTPTIDGDRLYALSVGGDLVCMTTDGGTVVWKKSMQRDFKGQRGGWGYAESPLIDGSKLIVTPGGREATIVALDKKSGQTVWKSSIPDRNGAEYASAIRFEADGQPMYVQFLKGGLVGVRAIDGMLMWRYARCANGTANCSAPVDLGGGRVLGASGYGTGGGAVQITPKGGKSADAAELYFSKDLKNQHGGVVLVGGYLYGANDPNLLACIDATSGKLQWQDRKPGKGCITAADGFLIYREEGGGEVMLIEASPKAYRETGRFKVPRNGGERAWAYPVVCDGRLYIRDWHTLYCYVIRD